MSDLAQWVVRHIGGTLETSGKATRLGVVCRDHRTATYTGRALAADLERLGAKWSESRRRFTVADVEVTFWSAGADGSAVRGLRLEEAWIDERCANPAACLEEVAICTNGETRVGPVGLR